MGKSRIALVLFGLVAGMIGAAYAAVPLYQVFCQVTGYGGTTRAAEAAPMRILDQDVTVRFDANTAPDLPWQFRPAAPQTLKIGELGLAKYTAANLSDRRVSGVATFNVTPAAAGRYFNKVACFCFTQQTLDPGEAVEMPVTFFVDPEIANDPNLKSIKTVTLSYTFFPDVGADEPQS